MEKKAHYASLDESSLLEELKHAATGQSQDHQNKRFLGLEELLGRFESGPIEEFDHAEEALLELAREQGDNQPQTLLIAECFKKLIETHPVSFQNIMAEISRKKDEDKQGRLIICFATLVPFLTYENQRKSIEPLVRFLMNVKIINQKGVEEIYGELLSLGNPRECNFGLEIAGEAAPFLSSPISPISPIYFSVDLCAKFADRRLLSELQNVLQKSITGYFGVHSQKIEVEICGYLARVKTPECLPYLIKLLKQRLNRSYGHINKAVAAILDANPSSIEHLLEVLYDERANLPMINAILKSFIEMGTKPLPISGHQLIDRIKVCYWDRFSQIGSLLEKLLVKIGENAKPVLFDMLHEPEKRDFAIACLKGIGISNEEIFEVFSKPVMLGIFDFLQSQTHKKKKFPRLNQLWEEPEKLTDKIELGSIDKLEYLLLHILIGFNFVTLNVSPLGIECIDIIGFFPETFDLLIIGATTGILKDDLKKMASQMKRFDTELLNLSNQCSVKPIIASSEKVPVDKLDLQFAADYEIIILQRKHVEKILEMLNTGRKTRELLDYIDEIYDSDIMPFSSEES